MLATLVSTFQWSRDGKRIQTVLLPNGGKSTFTKPAVATEPMVRVARDGKDPSRTYRYLLESPYEMQLLEHLLTGQLALIDVADGNVTRIGAPAMIRSVSTAPGEEQFRVATVKKPFSYYAPFQRFGATEGIWDREGKSLHTISDRNLRETEPAPAAVTTPAPGPGATKGGKGTGGFKGGGFKEGRERASRRDPTQPIPRPILRTRPTPRLAIRMTRALRRLRSIPTRSAR